MAGSRRCENGGGNNFAREREEQSWNTDQHEWIKTFLWDVANAKHAGELQFKTEEQGASGFAFAFELDHHFDVGIR